MRINFFFRFFSNPQIREIFFGKNYRNLIHFGINLIPNVLAALLEGLSFACILLALTALNSHSSLDLGNHSFLPMLATWTHSLSPRRAFVLFLMLAFILQILRSGLTYLGQITAISLGNQIQIEAQKKVYQQILRFTFPFVSQYKTGDLVEYAKIPATLINALMDPLNRFLVAGFAIIVSIGVMVFLSVPLTLFAVLLFGFLAFSQKFIISNVSKVSHHLSNHIVEFSMHMIQNLHGMRVIHTYARQENVMEKVLSTLNKIARSTKQLNLWSQSIPPLNEVMGIALVGTFLIIGEWLLGNQQTNSLPILLTFITIVHRLNSRVQAVLTNIATVASSSGQMLRLEEILSDRNKDFSSSGGLPFCEFTKAIEFQDVVLRYGEVRESAIQHLSFMIPKGATVAFVGSSGAGKSSIMDLLIRLYDPTSGKIRVDGVDLKEYNTASWRDTLGVVSQDTFIFNDTIEENIRFGLLDASMNQIIEAAQIAEAHEFITRLPNGYQTALGERGYRLSGGERQRIALARSLVRNPELLILDEATSSLDTQSERLIQKALSYFRGKKTVILVAHRLSTVLDADIIYVLEKGRIVESGSHAKLMAMEGRYSFFWNAQSSEIQKNRT